MSYFVGVDLGASALAVAVYDEAMNLKASHFAPVRSSAIAALKDAAALIWQTAGQDAVIVTTGSGASLAQAVLGAALTVDSLKCAEDYLRDALPNVRSLVKIGYEEAAVTHLYQPPKRRGRKNDCIRNLGAFFVQCLHYYHLSASQWDEAAQKWAETAGQAVHLSAKCPAFILRDMARLNQQGFPAGAVIAGVNDALARCYGQNIAKDDQFEDDVLLVGQLAQSESFRVALAAEIGANVLTLPEDGPLFFAQSAAHYARQHAPQACLWRAEQVQRDQYRHQFGRCEDGCENKCQLVKFLVSDEVKAVWGGKCDRWNDLSQLK